jgi:hypothetical protein
MSLLVAGWLLADISVDLDCLHQGKVKRVNNESNVSNTAFEMQESEMVWQRTYIGVLKGQLSVARLLLIS